MTNAVTDSNESDCGPRGDRPLLAMTITAGTETACEVECAGTLQKLLDTGQRDGADCSTLARLAGNCV
jgi:hypothetical protein